MSPFERMRAQLVERGLIRKVDGEYRLTEQGNDHARQIVARLKQERIEAA